MTDKTFAFLIHPIDPKRDVARRYPLLGKVLNEPLIHFFSGLWPPVYVSEVEGARSKETGEELRGWLVAAPYTPKRMLSVPVEAAYRKIVAAGHMAEDLGAKIFGLGAITSVVGDAGITIAERLELPVTTGDSLTVAVVVQAIEEAGHRMGSDLSEATVAVVGATGAIGSASAQLLAERCGEMVLIGRRPDALHTLRERCEGHRAEVSVSTDLHAMSRADFILSVTSSISAIIEPQHLKPGAVVCDVAMPKDVSRAVLAERDDVLVIEGGMVAIPGPVDFHFDFGYPPRTGWACLAETMALAMEGRFEDYTLGRDLHIDKIREVSSIAARHGFHLSSLSSFDRVVTPEHIAQVRQRAHDALRTWQPATS